jgi:Putative transposase/Transposase zinc-binding domain
VSVVAPLRAAPAVPARLELADIFSSHAEAYCRSHHVTASERKVIRAVMACRTAALGGHREWCQQCGHEWYRYHSCRNRHCPKCQTLAKASWLEKRQQELLPVPYFHNVFTLPHELNRLILASERNRRALLDLLFHAAAQTLLAFGQNNLGGKVGFTMVLHTWDQQLRPHFHVHCVIAAGALAEDGSRWIEAGQNFLFPVRALSKVFRAKYLGSLQKLLDADELDVPSYLDELSSRQHQRRWLRVLRRKAWLVYSKAPFAGPRKLLDYLGRYTHRVAISNHRLLACEHGQVRFAYRDRADGDRKKTASLSVEQFIGRFLLHVLPSGFMRIRHYGFLANRAKQSCLAQCREQLHASAPEPTPPKTVADWMLELTGVDITRCPHCGAPLESEHIAPLPPPGDRSRCDATSWDTS